MDAEHRIFVIEGLGGVGRSVNCFYNDNLRQRPNDKKYKLLYNPEVRFKNRMYMDFQVVIKKIKLRDTLTKIMGAPDVYLRAKVPEDIYDTLQKLAEMRKLDRIKHVRDFNLFPTTERLLNLERKYGDSLSHYDLYGIKAKPKRRRIMDGDETAMTMTVADPTETHTQYQATASQMSHTMPVGGKMVSSQVLQEATIFKHDDKRKADTDCHNVGFDETMRFRETQPKRDIIEGNRDRIATLTQGKPPRERMNIPEGVEVF